MAVRSSPPSIGRASTVAALALVALGIGETPLRAEIISVPNGSFESPTTSYVTNRIDAWQKTPKPFWYDESGGFTWDQLTGLFINPEPEKEGHILNCDGAQGVYLFAVPQVGFFQDYDSADSGTPTHAFDARFEVGKSYGLTVGVIGGGGAMKEGVSLLMSLYYRDSASNVVTVAESTLVFTLVRFPNTTNFVDCQVQVPTVKATDACAGQHIGVQFISTVAPELAGGYWDLDNVRLTAVTEPTLSTPTYAEGKFGFRVTSEPGLRFDILAASDLTLPTSIWTIVGTVTNTTGNMMFVDTSAVSGTRFYRARQLP